MSSEPQSWMKYSAPVEIDGKWIVTITDLSNAEVEQTKDFDSKEGADSFVKQQVVNQIEQDKRNKKAAHVAKLRGTKRTGNYVNANYELMELTDEQKKKIEASVNTIIDVMGKRMVPDYDGLSRLAKVHGFSGIKRIQVNKFSFNFYIFSIFI